MDILRPKRQQSLRSKRSMVSTSKIGVHIHGLVLDNLDEIQPKEVMRKVNSPGNSISNSNAVGYAAFKKWLSKCMNTDQKQWIDSFFYGVSTFCRLF